MTTGTNSDASSPASHRISASELAREAGFDTDLPVFKDRNAIALKLVELARMDESRACARYLRAWAEEFNEDTERDKEVKRWFGIAASRLEGSK